MKRKKILLNKPGKKKVVILFTEEGEEMEVVGMVLGRERGDYELDVLVDHRARNTNGRVVIKGIAENGARVKIKGMIKIEKQAQGADDFLEMRVLILDDESTAELEPKLEIEANDVKASHAATVGRVDEGQMFYLMARGLCRKSAEKVVVDGFLKN